jgi:hypothetical protein
VAAERLESVGNASEAHDALLHGAMALHRLGRSTEAALMARRVHQEALETGDFFAASTSLLLWTQAAGGRVPSMMIRVQVEISEQIEHRLTKIVAMQASGIRLLGVGRTREAAVALDDAATELQHSGVLSTDLLAELYVWRVTAWRRTAEHSGDPQQRATMLRRARRCLPRALWSAGRFRNGLPHALREAGRLAAHGGNMRSSRRLLDSSLSMALRHEQSQEAALTRIVRGELFGAHDAALAAEAHAAVDHGDSVAVGLRLDGKPGLSH